MASTVLVEQPPEIEFRAGLFYVVDDCGCRAYRPATFFLAIARAVEQSRQYRANGAEVVQLRPGHAASS
jgi:hypothetical protein